MFLILVGFGKLQWTHFQIWGSTSQKEFKYQIYYYFGSLILLWLKCCIKLVIKGVWVMWKIWNSSTGVSELCIPTKKKLYEFNIKISKIGVCLRGGYVVKVNKKMVKLRKRKEVGEEHEGSWFGRGLTQQW